MCRGHNRLDPATRTSVHKCYIDKAFCCVNSNSLIHACQLRGVRAPMYDRIDIVPVRQACQARPAAFATGAARLIHPEVSADSRFTGHLFQILLRRTEQVLL